MLIYIMSYLLAYLYLNRKGWDIFTRIISTLNALQCVYMVSKNLFNAKMFDLYYVADETSLNSLYIFSTYLVIDGIFIMPDFSSQFNPQIFLSLLHHFLGSLGIYLIASNQKGFFLGFYFAFTEVSTPLLNVLWVWKNPTLLKMFFYLFTACRIFTIPILLLYLQINKSAIQSLTPLNRFMSFYGSYSLILLNLIWFYYLRKKVSNLQIQKTNKKEINKTLENESSDENGIRDVGERFT